MNDLAILIGLISFPGLIATILCDKLLVHAERWNSFKYAVYTFVFGVSSYVTLQIVVWVINAMNRHLPLVTARSELKLWDTLISGKSLDFSEVAWATAVAPVVALLAVYLVNKKVVNRFGQRLGISNKYGDENLFSYFLNASDVYWIYVRDPSAGLSYRGAIRSFSETKNVQEIVMTSVTVYDYADSSELYRLDSIYLSKPLGSFIIEAPDSINKGDSNGGQEDSSARGRGTGPSERGCDPGDGNQAASVPTATAAAQEEMTSSVI
jgi:hypothetical protein